MRPPRRAGVSVVWMKLDRSEFLYPTPPIIITSIVGTVLIAMFHKASAHAPRRPLKLHTSRINVRSHDIRWATITNYTGIPQIYSLSVQLQIPDGELVSLSDAAEQNLPGAKEVLAHLLEGIATGSSGGHYTKDIGEKMVGGGGQTRRVDGRD